MSVVIRQVVIDYVNSHAAMNSGKEIFGWLIGSEKNDKLFIECAISSHRYETQTVIAAEPNLSETSVIASTLPIGVGIIGMYHSHPKTVFHSDTDDRTLRELTKLYSKAISIVTNADGDLKVYQLEKNDKPYQIEYEVKKEPISQFSQLIIVIEGVLKTAANITPINLMTALEKTIRNKFEEKISSFKNIPYSNQFSIPMAFKINVNETDQKGLESYSYEFRTIVDVSKNILESAGKEPHIITNGILMNLLLQLKNLTIESDSRKIIVPQRKTIYFQDIPLHFYLSSENEESSLNDFLVDMEKRREILDYGFRSIK